MNSKYPLYFAYGSDHEFLATDAAIAATPDERIKSIWPFMVRQTKQFWRSLKPRERVNFDPEDILSELWIRLRDMDDKWRPEDGKYITYAGVVIKCKLCSIRDKARTVESPRNSHGRLQEYEAEEAAGTITDRRLKTMNDIRRTNAGIQAILPATTADREKASVSTCLEPSELISGIEDNAAVMDAIRTAAKDLPALEASVIGKVYGLCGRQQMTLWEIAWESGREVDEVRRAKTRAFEKIGKHLLAIRHPAAECGED